MNQNFNIGGGDLYLAVGPNQTRFRCHSHFFLRESEWWKKELLGPESHADAPLRRGTSPTTAYPLRDESPEDFRQLLGVFYNNNYGNYSHIGIDQWLVIHHYAHKWSFKEVQALAMRSLDNQHMDTAERIVLYQRNKIPIKYIIPYYITLITRPEGLDLEECRILGYKTNWFLHHARNDLYTKVLSLNSARSFNDIDEAEVENIVKVAYKRTINKMDPTPGSSTVTKVPPEHPAGDAKDKDERGKSDAGSWEDVGGDPDEEWEDLSVPGSFR